MPSCEADASGGTSPSLPAGKSGEDKRKEKRKDLTARSNGRNVHVGSRWPGIGRSVLPGDPPGAGQGGRRSQEGQAAQRFYKNREPFGDGPLDDEPLDERTGRLLLRGFRRLVQDEQRDRARALRSRSVRIVLTGAQHAAVFGCRAIGPGPGSAGLALPFAREPL